MARPIIRVLPSTWADRLTNGRIGGNHLHGVPVLRPTVMLSPC